MPLPGVFEACALHSSALLFDAWVNRAPGMTILHSHTPDKKSFQAGYITAMMEVLWAEDEERKTKTSVQAP